MTETLQVKDGRVVFLQYVLRDDEGEVLDQSTPDQPLFYLHGAQNIVPGLERELTDKSVGDQLTVVVAPEDGYGVRHENSAQRVHRREFPKNFELFEGRQLVVQNTDGQPVPLWITQIQGAWIWIDRNHPLAGKTLHFEVEITRVRLATNEEIEHSHPHGPEGTSGHGH